MVHSKYGAHRVPLHKHLPPPNPAIIPFINMPRSVQPGGVSRQMRVRYTACRKLGLLTAAERLQHEKGMTIRNAAEELLVAHSLIVKWKKQQRAGGGACPIMAMIKSMKKAAHAGPLGQLKSIEQDLLRTLFKYREQGVKVNTFLVVVQASSLSPEFKAKSFTARQSASCAPIRSSIEWARTKRSTSLRKLRVRRRTTCVL